MSKAGRYGAGRTTGSRPVLPVLTVICDDTETAVAYFRLLKLEVKDRKTVYVVPAPHCGATAAAVIQHAKSKMPETAEVGDATFVIVDVDTNPNAEGQRAACKAAGIDLVLSKPCFEVWILAHFQDTGEAFIDCAAVVSRVSAKWSEFFGQEMGVKSQADYAKIMSMRNHALERCKRRNASTSQSWTEVWRVVDTIIQ